MSTRLSLQSEADEELNEILSDFSQFYVLLLLSEEPTHGYGLIKKFRNRTGRNLSAGTLYPFLQRLMSEGIAQQSDKSTGKRPKLIYSLTMRGKRFCEELFSRFAAITVSAIEPSMETCASCCVRIYDGGHHEEVDGTKLAFCCSHCAEAFKRQMFVVG
ncbi:MAG: PadR family transcriptional regulator [Candidatus Thorarchaeota archaeon]|jgi:DNA-binding PadR family transcriptional regulator